MKIHFGIMYNDGDYEHPEIACEKTLCGYSGEEVIENAVDVWDLVTCKKCLKLREKYSKARLDDEKEIVKQMGDMVNFLKSESKNI